MWKRKAQRIENKTVRVIDKVLKDSKNITNAMAWLRRNYPEAFKKEVEQMKIIETRNDVYLKKRGKLYWLRGSIAIEVETIKEVSE